MGKPKGRIDALNSSRQEGDNGKSFSAKCWESTPLGERNVGGVVSRLSSSEGSVAVPAKSGLSQKESVNR